MSQARLFPTKVPNLVLENCFISAFQSVFRVTQGFPSWPLIILLQKTVLFGWFFVLGMPFHRGLALNCLLLAISWPLFLLRGPVVLTNPITFLIVTTYAWHFACCVSNFTGSPYICLSRWLSPTQTHVIAGFNWSGMISPERDAEIEFGIYDIYLVSHLWKEEDRFERGRGKVHVF